MKLLTPQRYFTFADGNLNSQDSLGGNSKTVMIGMLLYILED